MSRCTLQSLCTRRQFVANGATAILGVGIGRNMPYTFAADRSLPRITPDLFRRAEGTLTLLGNPTEAVTIDLVEQAKAWDKAVADFAAHGVHLFFPHIPVTDCWKGKDQYDFSEMDAVIKQTLNSDPRSSLILRLRLNAPPWWIDARPDQVLLYSDGSDSVKTHWGTDIKTPSLASTLWRSDVESLLRALVKHVQQSNYARQVIGYHPALLHGGEWFQEGALYGKKADYSPLMQNAFRSWLQRKYGSEDVGENIIPTAEQRNVGDIGHLRDPTKSRRILDYYDFYQQQFAEQAEGYCRSIKEATAGKAITGFYYGYSIIFSTWPGRLQCSGHLALHRVLESPHVDYIGSMRLYDFREPGGFSWSFGPIADSARVHGKVYVAEDEARSWLGSHRGKEYGYIALSRTPDEEINYLKRSFACAMSHREHEALADLGGGWYDDPKIMSCIGRLGRVAADSAVSRASASQIAVFLDETAYFYQDETHDTDLNSALISRSLPEFFHIGAPIDMYLFSDLINGRVPIKNYKLIVLLNCWHLTDSQRKLIKNKVQRDRRWVISYYAAGFLGQAGSSLEGIHELTGITVKMNAEPATLTITSNGRTYGTNRVVFPTFYADDPDSKVIAQQSGSARPAVSAKHLGDWTSVYASVPTLPADLLRKIAKSAGVHLYVDSYDLIHATQGFLAIHAGEEGAKRIRLPKVCSLYDLYEDTISARGVRELSVQLRKGDTRMWRIMK
jgi:hypothetical protein